jgi:glutamate synthase domain-containing protein 1
MRSIVQTGWDPQSPWPPARQGLYDPAHERDACGLGFIAHIKGHKSHAIVTQGLSILKNLTHRGATGADPLQGDGAGILIQIPDAFLRRACGRQGLTLPAAGHYGVGMVFLPKEPASRMACEQEIERAIASEGQMLLGWRDVPTDNSGLSTRTIEVEPVIRQVFVARGSNDMDQDALERKLYIIRKKSGHAIQALRLQHGKEFYVPSMSSRTLVYKGMLLAHQVGEYFRDLKDATMVSALAMVHQRFSTNTFPTWDLAHRSGSCATTARSIRCAATTQPDTRTPARHRQYRAGQGPRQDLAPDLRRAVTRHPSTTRSSFS